MSKDISLYIGAEQADFNEEFNVMFSIGDIRSMQFGNSNKSYTLNLPLTAKNKKLIQFINSSDVKTEPDATGKLYIGELLIFQGKVTITGSQDNYAKVILNSDDWIDALKDKKLSELDLSAYVHYMTHATIESSWSAVNAFYRYPMINFGSIESLGLGAAAVWTPMDFIPMIRVVDLIRMILQPYQVIPGVDELTDIMSVVVPPGSLPAPPGIYDDLEITISNQRGLIYGELVITNSNQDFMPWINQPWVKNLYIIGTEKVDTSFIIGKQLTAAVTDATDNNSNLLIPADDELSVEIDKTLVFLTETKDEASAFDYNAGIYTIPATGTYRFTAVIKLRNTCYTEQDLTITDETLDLKLKLLRVTETILDSYNAGAYGVTELIDAKTITLDSGYYHFIIGDQVYVDIQSNCIAHNDGVAGVTVNLGTISGTTFVNVWNNANLHPGRNAPIDLENWLPDMSQLDFLAAIRDIFNLRFWMDKMRRTVYVEPWDTFISDQVIDLTDKIDHEDPPVDLISQSYNKEITLKFKDDTKDKAIEEYLKTAVSLGQKIITLESVFCKAGPDAIENIFSTIVTGYIEWMSMYTAQVARIYNTNVPLSSVYDRPVGFNTKIVSWDGLTSGFTWYYETDTKTTYPKISALDFDYIYSTWWQRLFHYIDRGKLFPIRMKIDPIFLSQFLTVINDAEKEGFRPIYKITLKRVDNYFILQKITANSQRCELELFIKC